MFNKIRAIMAETRRSQAELDRIIAMAELQLQKVRYTYHQTSAAYFLRSEAVEAMVIRNSRVNYVVYRSLKKSVHAHERQAAVRTIVRKDRKGLFAHKSKALTRTMRAAKRTIVWRDSADLRSEQHAETLRVARVRLQIARDMRVQVLALQASEKTYTECCAACAALHPGVSLE